MTRRSSNADDQDSDVEVNSRRPWTIAEPNEIPPSWLPQIHRLDLATEIVPSENEDDLKNLIVTEQANRRYRGTLRWVPHGSAEIILYQPHAARHARYVVRLAEQVDEVADLQRLLRRDPDVGQLVLDHIWDRWTNGWTSEFGVDDATEPPWNSVGAVEELIALLPADAPCGISNSTDDGDYVFFDPFDPVQMRVPLLIVHRFVVDQANMVSSWQSVPREDLDGVRSSLNAIGWRLSPGKAADVTF